MCVHLSLPLLADERVFICQFPLADELVQSLLSIISFAVCVTFPIKQIVGEDLRARGSALIDSAVSGLCTALDLLKKLPSVSTDRVSSASALPRSPVLSPLSLPLNSRFPSHTGRVPAPPPHRPDVRVLQVPEPLPCCSRSA